MLGSGNQTRELRDRSLRDGELHLRLIYVDLRFRALLETCGHDLEAIPAPLRGLDGDLQPPVQIAEQEVGVGDAPHQADRHVSIGGLRREQVGSRGFGRARVASPEVDLEAQVRTEAEITVRSCEGIDLTTLAPATRRSEHVEKGKLVCAGEGHQIGGLFHPRHRDGQVLILRQRSRDQLRQGLVPVDLPPGQVCDRLPRRTLAPPGFG